MIRAVVSAAAGDRQVRRTTLMLKRLELGTVALVGTVALHAQTQPSSPAPPRDIAQASATALAIGTATIRGRIVAADNGAPLRNVRVSLTMGADSADQEPLLTDSEGRFQFANLGPGGYIVSASKAGYLATRFGSRTPFDRPVTVLLIQAAIADNIDLRLFKAGAISGRIVDDIGDPAVGATVVAVRVTLVDGRPRMTNVKTTQTDDLGEYRLGGLPAGRFLIAAGGGGGRATRWTRTFLPGTVSVSRAQTVTIATGDEVTGRDFSVTPAGGGHNPVTISGVIVDSSGNAAAGTLVDATVDGPAGFASATSHRIPPDARFSHVAEPGDHILMAQGPAGVAGLRVSVVDTDITGIRLTLAPGGRASGQIVFDGSNPPPVSDVDVDAWNPDFESSLAAGPPGPGAQPLKVNRDGTFQIANLFGTRVLRVSKAPRGWSVKAMTVNGRSIADVPVDFDGGRELTGVQIVLTNRAAQLAGSVIDSDRKAVRDYSVVVFPSDPFGLQYPSRVVQWVRPDHTGRFTVDGLRAGSYLAVALDEVDDSEWTNADYLERLRPHATSVTLADGERKTISLERLTQS
jgi:hypothetical protein